MTSNRLRCERLEDRHTPAGGNVSVALIGTQLFVQGDSADNAVGVYQDASGIQVVGGYGTTVNGLAAVNVGTAIPTEVSIQGGFGNDLIDVRGLVASNAILLESGAGDDGVSFNTVRSTYLTMNLGDGSDWLQISGVVAYAVDISGGAGFDPVQNRGVSTTWGGFRDFESSVGAPAGNVSAFLFGSQLYITGDGFDNAVSTQQDAAGNIVVVGVNGTTINGLSEVHFGPGILRDVIVRGGGGNDLIDVAGVLVTNGISVETGNGNDQISLRNVTAQYIAAYSHGGSDALMTTNVRVGIGFDFKGGLGTDYWQNRGIVYGVWASVMEFEAFV
jgi:hypothetical protein